MLVRVGSSNDVTAGQMRVFDVAGTKVSVTSVDGHLYAFDDTCHGSQFDLTSGAVLRGPATRPVRSRLVQVEGDDLLAEA